MNSNYKVIKFKKNKFEKIDDLISIEEPLEISIKYKDQNEWVTSSLSITMRTPGHDEDLVRGFLFNEQIIQNLNEIDEIESIGEKVGQYKIQNKILITLNNSKNINISKIKRDFLTNSSCGVCGKSSLDALEIIKKEKTFKDEPKLVKEIIIRSPLILRQNQSEFSKTGGIHASGLFSSDGKLISLREDVGRHNALDKLIGQALLSNELPLSDYGIIVSGRASFELMQKAMMAGVPLLAAVGAPSSLAVELAEEFGMTLIGFLKKDKFNIYTRSDRIR